MSRKIFKIAIAVGGNVGDSASIFRSAMLKLAGGGVEKIRLSRLITTKPENCPPGSPDFTNAVLIGKWRGSAQKLLKLCQAIEVASGRPAEHEFNAPRTLDLDIILFGEEIINLPELQVPHPRAAERLFVLQPLAEIASSWIFPDSGKPVKELLEKIKS
jgi:2-amino-4-hydroxy-6-hydroxymethyldihydropteridine diphosphokinase